MDFELGVPSINQPTSGKNASMVRIIIEPHEMVAVTATIFGYEKGMTLEVRHCPHRHKIWSSLVSTIRGPPSTVVA